MFKKLLKARLVLLRLFVAFLLFFSVNFSSTAYAFSLDSITSATSSFTNTLATLNVYDGYVSWLNNYRSYIEESAGSLSTAVVETFSGYYDSYVNGLSSLSQNFISLSAQVGSFFSNNFDTLTIGSSTTPTNPITDPTTPTPTTTTTTTVTPAPSPVVVIGNSLPRSTPINDSTLLPILERLLNRPDIQNQLRGPAGTTGPQGPAGPAGTSGGFTPLAPPAWAPPSNNNNQVIGNSGGFASLGVQDLTATTLHVTGNSTVLNLNVTGSLTGNVVGSINPSLTLGSVFFQGASGIDEDNANFFWDDTTNALGIGTGSPDATLEVSGAGSGSYATLPSLSVFSTPDAFTWNAIFKNTTGPDFAGLYFNTSVLNLSSATEDPIMSWDTLTGDVEIPQGTLALGLAAVNKGILKLSGDTSGTVTIQPASAAGTYTLTLPADDGTPSQFLQTNGSGALTWATLSSGLTVGTTTITSGTDTRILYDNAGVLGEMTTTGSGTVVVLATSPTLVTPTLGAATYTTLTGGNLISTGTANRFGTATTADALADTLFATSATTQKGLVIQGKALQTANLQEWQDSTGAVLSSISFSGLPDFPGAGGATSQRIGSGSSATGAGATAVGYNTVAAADATVFGAYSNAATLGTALGRSATAGNSIAIGYGTYNLGGSSDAATISIGYQAGSLFSAAIAIGRAATTTAANQLVIGGSQSVGAQISSTYIGDGVTDATPISTSINATGGSGTNIAGASLTLAGGKATGNAAGGSLIFQTSDAGASGATLQSLTTKMTILGNGNVGIGTASPTTSFEVQSDSNIRLRSLTFPGYYTDYLLNGVDFVGAGQVYRFLLSGSEKMRINSNGFVGIGATVPGNLLTVTAPTTADALADVMIGTTATTQKGLVIQGLASQTANLQEWQISTGAVKALVNAAGEFSNPTGGANAEEFGAGAVATNDAVAIGYNASASGGGGGEIAIGKGATASGLVGLAIGYHASAGHSGAITIGRSATSTAASQLVIGGGPDGYNTISDVYIGTGVTNATPGGVVYHASGGSGTDIAGASLTLAGGKATGNAIGGALVFQTSDAGASGATLQSLTTKATLVASGNFGIGTTGPDKKLDVLDAATAQLRLTSADGTIYSELYADSAGELRISSTGADVRLNEENFWVCAGGSCAPSAPAENGNIIVETSIILNNNFRLKQTSATTVDMLDSGANIILQFDEAAS